MCETFGARLRQRREAQDIALIAVANQTKIKLSLLEALERDEVSQWPSGFYRRAFLRAYALAVGLNPDDVVREFQEAFPEPPAFAAASPAPAMWTEEPLTDRGAPTRLRYLFGSAIDRLRRGRTSDDRPAFSGPPALVAVSLGPRALIPSPDPEPAEPVDLGKPEEPVTFAEAAPSRSCEPEPAGVCELEAPDSSGVHETDLLRAVEDEREFAGESVVEVAPSRWQNAETTTLAEAAAPIEAPLRIEDAGFASCTPDRDEPEPDLLAVASLCTDLGRAENTAQIQAILAEAARILDAAGLIVWIWDGAGSELRPALASGYSDRVLAQLPTVKRDADNPTAAAFRSAQTCVVGSRGSARGALVIPLLAPGGCAGVLALELRAASDAAVRFSRAAATIFASLLAQVVGSAAPAELDAPEYLAARSG